MTISTNEIATSPYAWWHKQQTTSPSEDVSRLVSVREASKFVGCSSAHLRRMIAAGLLRSVRFGDKGSHRIPWSELVRISKLKEQKNNAE
ncbi:MAG TPA: helix-turn-helix domain-containing protein [Terriglobales bacterium]|nr:helix-turn-helix domain-containing protein [Terriglobales bacterium]